MSLRDIIFRNTREPATETRDMDKETGVSGDAVFESLDNELKRSDKVSVKTYREMRDTDTTLDMLYNIVTLPILAATYEVKASDKDTDGEQVEFIRNCLFSLPYQGGMEIPFGIVLDQMLHAYVDGFELFERVYRYDEATGKLVYRKLALRDAKTITLKADKYGAYDGANQTAQYGDRNVDVDFPARKTFLFTYGKGDDLLYGRSAFKSSYGNWEKKRKIEYLDSIALQNAAVRAKIATRTSNAVVKGNGEDTKNKVLRALSKLGFLKPVAAIPYGYEVKELEGGNNSGMHESIERQNSEMARAFLASFALLGSQGTHSVGSYSLSADQSDLFMVALKGKMQNIEDHINQYWIADLIDLNYPVGRRFYPSFKFNDLTDGTTDFLKNIFMKLVEKDRISDGLVSGIEEQVVTRFEIDPVEREAVENASDIGTNRQSSNEATSDNMDTSSNNQPADTQKKVAEEDNGSDADKFRREATDIERKVNWRAIERQNEKIGEEFQNKGLPLLQEYIEQVAEKPDQKIELPEAYIKLITDTYRKSYNYGKLSASDEEDKKAPKTKEEELSHTKQYVDFIIEKQTADIENLVRSAKLELSVNETIVAESSLIKGLKDNILVTGLAWAFQAIVGTANTIFNYGMNDGRNDAYSVFDKEEQATYMWSALLENSCATCLDLDGTTYSSREARTLRFQPGKVHFNCHCIWVRETGEQKSKPTGLPDNIDITYHLQVTPKGELQKQGLVGADETKVNAIRTLEYNNADSGETLDEVMKNIRDRETEVVVAFDKNGNKISDYTSNLPSQVLVRDVDSFNKYLKDNMVSVTVHNHPGGTSFSDTDIMTATKQNLGELLVVAKGATYSLKPGANGWPSDLKDLEEFYEKQYEKYRHEIAIAVNNGIVTPRDENQRWIIDKTVSDVAQKYKLVYNVHKKDKKWLDLQ